MNAGIFVVASLTAAPVDAADCATIFAASADGGFAVEGCRVAWREPDAAAVHIRQTDDGVDILIGALDRPADVARRLSLSDDGDQARLAAVAHDRWGADAAAHLDGEWMLVRWHAAARTVTLATSACIRDFSYFVTDGSRVVVAPDLLQLARLAWIDVAVDGAMLEREFWRSARDPAVLRRTILRQVMQLLPGESVTIGADGVRIDVAAPPPPPTPIALGFDDAMAAVDVLLRDAMRRELARCGDVAVLLSGGLDSSLLAWMAATERRAGQRLTFLTSAVPPDSGLVDESDWAELVARHLDVPLIRVVPADDADIYRASPRRMARAPGPSLAQRHYLYDAFEEAAVAIGASRLIDGNYGELTVSGYGDLLDPPPWWTSPRGIARRVRDVVRGLGRSGEVADDACFVQPSRSALARRGPQATVAHPRHPPRGALYGYDAGWEKSAKRASTSNHPALRYLFPFRNRALGALMAGLPADHVTHGGIARAPIRALLKGRLPDRITWRESKMPFSPGYESMLRAHALAAIARIPAHRDAGAGEWLDLNWLEATLRRADAGVPMTQDTQMRLQATAQSAEFFSWWASAVRPGA